MRVAAYCRVSTQEQVEGYSLDAQRHIIDQFAALRGWSEVVYHAEGVSAFTDEISKRPVFAAMLAAAERGEYDAIIVHKLDRFARSLILTLTELTRLERAGVSFVSVAEQFDFTTSIGRVVLAVLASFAEYYSRNLSTEVRKGLDQRRLSGGHVGGVPWGAVRDTAGRLAVDPDKADALALLLALATERSDDLVARELNRRGVAPPRSPTGHWRQTGVTAVIHHGAWLLDQPPPWPERYAAARSRPRLPRGNRQRQVRLLSGLMRCACGGIVVYGGHRRPGPDGTRAPGVQCRRYDRTRIGSERCPYQPKTIAAVYEQQVEDWLLALPDLRGVEYAPVALDEGRADLAQRRRRLGLALADGMITEADYRARKTALEEEEARLPLAAVAPRELALVLWVTQQHWDELPVPDRNAALRLLVERVVIGGTAATVEPAPGLAFMLARYG